MADQAPPQKWACHSDRNPYRGPNPERFLQDRLCGFWHLEAANEAMANETRRCSGCRYGPERPHD